MDTYELTKKIIWIKNNTKFTTIKLICKTIFDIYDIKINQNFLSKICKLTKLEKENDVIEEFKNLKIKKVMALHDFIETIYDKENMDTKEFLVKQYKRFKIKIRKYVDKKMIELDKKVGL